MPRMTAEAAAERAARREAAEAAAERAARREAAAMAQAEKLLTKGVKGSVQAAGLLPAIGDTYRVASSRYTDKADVANQAAAGAGRWATAGLGAEAGAALGALGGPAAVVTAPLGAMIGGAAGYVGGDKLIRAGRKFFGAEEDDPLEPIKKYAASGKRKLQMRETGTPESPGLLPQSYGYAVRRFRQANPNWRNLPTPDAREVDALTALGDPRIGLKDYDNHLYHEDRPSGFAKGGSIKRKGKTNTKMVKMASGGSVSSRADGIAKKGKTNCKYR